MPKQSGSEFKAPMEARSITHFTAHQSPAWVLFFKTMKLNARRGEQFRDVVLCARHFFAIIMSVCSDRAWFNYVRMGNSGCMNQCAVTFLAAKFSSAVHQRLCLCLCIGIVLRGPKHAASNAWGVRANLNLSARVQTWLLKKLSCVFLFASICSTLRAGNCYRFKSLLFSAWILFQRSANFHRWN